ncbi:MAG: hypothetical protein H0X34_17210 [Chthoniobacterales bacterium]|nr:hypothetical protein [Chthoniobacterales bacterium]
MNAADLLKLVLAGRFVLVGEYRGGRAELRGFVDRKTGLAASSVIVSYVVECAISGDFDMVKVSRKAPEAVTLPEQVEITLTKGKRYAFEIESLSKERGLIAAWLGSREPQPLEEDRGMQSPPEAGAAP